MMAVSVVSPKATGFSSRIPVPSRLCGRLPPVTIPSLALPRSQIPVRKATAVSLEPVRAKADVKVAQAFTKAKKETVVKPIGKTASAPEPVAKGSPIQKSRIPLSSRLAMPLPARSTPKPAPKLASTASRSAPPKSIQQPKPRAPAVQPKMAATSRSALKALSQPPVRKALEQPPRLLKSALKTVRLDVKPKVGISWGSEDPTSTSKKLENVKEFRKFQIIERPNGLGELKPVPRIQFERVKSNFDQKFTNFSSKECRRAWGIFDDEDSMPGSMPPKTPVEIDWEQENDEIYFPGNVAGGMGRAKFCDMWDELRY